LAWCWAARLQQAFLTSALAFAFSIEADEPRLHLPARDPLRRLSDQAHLLQQQSHRQWRGLPTRCRSEVTRPPGLVVERTSGPSSTRLSLFVALALVLTNASSQLGPTDVKCVSSRVPHTRTNLVGNSFADLILQPWRVEVLAGSLMGVFSRHALRVLIGFRPLDRRRCTLLRLHVVSVFTQARRIGYGSCGLLFLLRSLFLQLFHSRVKFSFLIQQMIKLDQ
jgi:hypothetical protein